MNREEILARSQQENHGQDIADLEISKSSMQVGWIVLICLLAFVTVVDTIVFGRMNSGVLFAVMAGSAVVFACKYRKLRRTHELVVTVAYSVAAAAFLISWILQLVH